ncbi:MAG TPA: hypothetical protein VMP68_21020 [Candidatus Eisenbacteria bacterium]|nr:hypothetical protein [Candidatus Eisenbacteria bacterium]
MPRTIDQIRASKLPSNMMQFAARGALQVPAAENIEILVHLALHNKVFGELARMTLAGWDEKASLAAASDPQTSREVLDYFISPDNLRPKLLPALLENPSVPESQVIKLATSAMRDTIDLILKSERARSIPAVVKSLQSNPYLKKEEAEELRRRLEGGKEVAPETKAMPAPSVDAESPKVTGTPTGGNGAATAAPESGTHSTESEADGAGPHDPEADEAVSVYMKDHAHDIAAEGEKPFQSIGGVVELLGQEYFPVIETATVDASEASADAPSPVVASASAAAKPAPAKPVMGKAAAPVKPGEPKRENALQKINRLDVKGRIQLALKGNKEERSLLIRDGTKVVALAVLEAPKLADGEVEKFASQKNVLEAVLRQIPLKRRFMKNYIVVRNLCANPRTPLDLGLGLMKNLLIQDLKNISANKEVSETIRKLALKMYKQKLDDANKK